MDARYYNGGPDDHTRLESYGTRRELDDPHAGVTFICQRCGGSVQYVYSLAGVGVFCSERCKTAVEMAASDRSPREYATAMDEARRG